MCTSRSPGGEVESLSDFACIWRVLLISGAGWSRCDDDEPHEKERLHEEGISLVHFDLHVWGHRRM